jgi:cysteine desulfurase
MKIYLDNNATTPLAPEAFQVMQEELLGPPSNPSSVHSYGREAKSKLQKARDTVAAHFGVSPSQVIFTSGATEGINTLIHSLRSGFATTLLEHPAVYETAQSTLQPLHYLPVQASGAPDLSSLPSMPLFLSTANSETGIKLDLTALSSHPYPIFLDATASVGREKLLLPPNLSALAFSAHKFHGPKGVGAIILFDRSLFRPLLIGGSQEEGRRAGTENLAGILGLAKALEIAPLTSLAYLRDRFEELLPMAEQNGTGERVSHVSNLFFPGVDGESLLFRLDLAGVAASHGSACRAGALEPSRTLLAMGYSKNRARSSLRFSFSRFNTLEEVEKSAAILLDLL